MKCFSIDVHIYSTSASSSFSFLFFFLLFNCHVSCWLFVMLIVMYAFTVLFFEGEGKLIVVWILMLIMYSAASS